MSEAIMKPAMIALFCMVACACADKPDPRDIAWAEYAKAHECRRTSPHWWKCESPTPEIWAEPQPMEITTETIFCTSEWGLCE